MNEDEAVPFIRKCLKLTPNSQINLEKLIELAGEKNINKKIFTEINKNSTD